MRKAIKILALGAALAATTGLAKADQVNGVLHFASTPLGDVTYVDGGDPSLSFTNPGSSGLSGDNSGDFTSIPTGTGIYLTNFTAGSLPAGTIFSVDGVTFDATSDSVAYDSNDFLDITLFGTIIDPGFDNTSGILLIETNGKAGSGTSYAGTLTATPTPEPSSLALLGTTLLGAAGMARRRFMSR